MTAPTITYGHGLLLDFNITTASLQADWTEHEDGNVGTYTISQDSAYLHITANGGNEIYYIDNDTDFALSTVTYPYLLYRYKCSSSSMKAKIIAVFSDADTQTILNNGTATTWTTGLVELTTGKQLDHLQLYANDAPYDVYYEFILIFKGTFTFPQYAKIDWNYQNNYTSLGTPGRIGNIKQYMGARELEVTVYGDLDDQRANWKRSNDSLAAQIFEDIHHNAYTELWQWFTHDRGAFKAVIEDLNFTEDRNQQYLYSFNIKLSEYRSFGGQNETYKERLKIS